MPLLFVIVWEIAVYLSVGDANNAECRMQNAKSLCRLRRLILIISEGNTAIFHFAFFILHLGRQHHKLKFASMRL